MSASIVANLRERMSDVPTLTLHVPQPPSANHLRIPIGARRRKSASGKFSRVGPTMINSRAYKDWQLLAGLRCNTQVSGYSLPGRYAIRYTLAPGLDIDNVCKPAGDLMQKLHIVSNDRLCERLEVERDYGITPGTVRIEIWDVEPRE